MARKVSKKTLKAKLDKIFSQYIRIRDADENGYAHCCTCGKIAPIEEMHAGHFRSRRYLSTRWDERNVNTQCPLCNAFRGGEQYLHGKYIAEKYGEDMPDRLTKLSQEIHKYSIDVYEELIEEYGGAVKRNFNKSYKKALESLPEYEQDFIQ